MLGKFLAASLFAALLLSAGAAHAGEMRTREDAVNTVRRVQEKFHKDGADATLQAVTQQHFNDRDLYPFVCDFDGIVVGHGGFPVLVGKNLISLRDQDGKFLTQRMIDIAKSEGKGWISYRWPNPLTRRMESKSTYIEKMGPYLVGVGIWLPNEGAAASSEAKR
jgi:cytochrome c